MQDSTVREHLERAWHERANDLVSRLRELRAHSGRESVRLTRRAVRQLRFLLDEFGHHSEEEPSPRLDRELRRLSRALGPARDAAVHETCTRSVARAAKRAHKPKLAAAGLALARRLRDRRRGYTWRVIDATAAALRSGLADRLTTCRWTTPDAPASDYTAATFASSCREIAESGHCLVTEDDIAARHDLRKRARPPLTTIAIFGASAPAASRDAIEALQSLRRHLGDLHDLEETAALLRDFRDVECAAAGSLTDYADVRAGKLESFFDWAETRLATDHAKLLTRTREAWPGWRERLISRNVNNFPLDGSTRECR